MHNSESHQDSELEEGTEFDMSSLENNQELINYIANIPLSKNGPGLLLKWNPNVVSRFSRQINAALQDPNRAAEIHEWISRNEHGLVVTKVGLMKSVVDLMKNMGSKLSFGWIFLAPNDINKFSNVLGGLNFIQNNPFMQATMKAVNAAHPTPAPIYLASVVIAHNKEIATWKNLGLQRIQHDQVHLFN